MYKNLIFKREKIEPRFQVNDLVRTADLKKTFLRRDTTNWSSKMYLLQKQLMIQYQVIKSTILKKDIMKLY